MHIEAKYVQILLFTVPLNVGWYYAYNPDQKPLDAMMLVCRLMEWQPQSETCKIHVWGDAFFRDAIVSDLVPFVARRECDIISLTRVLESVPLPQLKIWHLAAGMLPPAELEASLSTGPQDPLKINRRKSKYSRGLHGFLGLDKTGLSRYAICSWQTQAYAK